MTETARRQSPPLARAAATFTGGKYAGRPFAVAVLPLLSAPLLSALIIPAVILLSRRSTATG